MRDGNSETETELQAAERRISKIQRCGAARVASMEQSFLGLLEAIGEDTQREGLVRTPGRAARAFEFLTAGYRQSLDGIINNALFDSEASEIILVKDIELYSLCEHHLIPFIGKAHVAYIPNGKVVGLSKTARIVDMFARRLQIQENLTMQIADALTNALRIPLAAERLTVGRSPRRTPLNSGAVSRRRPTINHAPNRQQAPRILR